MRASLKHQIASSTVVATLAVTACGGSRAAPASTHSEVETAASITMTHAPTASGTAPASPTTTVVPTPSVTTATPTFSGGAGAAFKKACGYVSGDLGALTGELKMSNLTGGELTEAARYVAEDLDAVKRHLGVPGKHRIARALAVLAAAETVPRSRGVSLQESRSLGATFAAAPFTTLGTLVRAACRRQAGRGRP